MAIPEVNLGDAVVRQLDTLAQDETNPSLQKRARILLLYNQGMSTDAIADQIGLSASRTRYWRRQFVLRGLDIFGPLPGDNLEEDVEPAPEARPPRSKDELAKKVKSIKKKLKSKKLKGKKARKLKARLKSLEKEASRLGKKRKKKAKKEKRKGKEK
jgi:hypothetical protein